MDQPSTSPAKDIHSYANTAEVRIAHVALNLDVDFATHRLVGTATLELEGTAPAVILDTRDLEIFAAETSPDGETFTPTEFELGSGDPILGTPLAVNLTTGTSHVRVRYATSPQASGLQWLEPAQTAGGREPYLFSQSLARRPAGNRDWPNVAEWLDEAVERVDLTVIRRQLIDAPRSAWRRAGYLLAVGGRADAGTALIESEPAGSGPVYLGPREGDGRFDKRFDVIDAVLAPTVTAAER